MWSLCKRGEEREGKLGKFKELRKDVSELRRKRRRGSVEVLITWKEIYKDIEIEDVG